MGRRQNIQNAIDHTLTYSTRDLVKYSWLIINIIKRHQTKSFSDGLLISYFTHEPLLVIKCTVILHTAPSRQNIYLLVDPIQLTQYTLMLCLGERLTDQEVDLILKYTGTEEDLDGNIKYEGK